MGKELDHQKFVEFAFLNSKNNETFKVSIPARYVDEIIGLLNEVRPTPLQLNLDAPFAQGEDDESKAKKMITHLQSKVKRDHYPAPKAIFRKENV